MNSYDFLINLRCDTAAQFLLLRSLLANWAIERHRAVMYIASVTIDRSLGSIP